MKKIVASLVIALVISLGIINVSFAQETQTIKGTISQIAEDETSITVNGQVILISTEISESYYLEVGDEIELVVEQTPEGLSATAVKYPTEATTETATEGTEQ